jgi:UDP-N-acetylmuramate dehydrogenase
MLHQNFSLQPYNSFGIKAMAKQFAVFNHIDQLPTLLNQKTPNDPLLILGGGSNVLFTKDFDGCVLKNEIMGVEQVAEDEDFYYVRVGAGENWHQFVLHCLQQHWAGVENLSLIPGNVGAGPMQNIGAYGVELKDVFHELRAFHLQHHVLQTFDLAACAFGYRESVFKKTLKNQFCIVDVTFKLRKTPVLNTSYGAIAKELEKMGVQTPSIQNISQAVINIRSSKLPDPKQIGNAGSFFKNPTVSNLVFLDLLQQYPQMPNYPQANGQVKLAAGWLIEQCGWKGYRKGDAGCHSQQALVLVNHGQATGNEIAELSDAIIQSVNKKFNIELEKEVNLY